MAFPGIFGRDTPAPTKTATARAKPSAKQLSLLSNRDDLGCAHCPLNTDTRLRHPKMLPTGAGTDDHAYSEDVLFYFIGEAPGGQEDDEGSQFIGKAGKRLRGVIPKKWLPFIRWNNTLRCRPTTPNGEKDRAPTPLESACCRPLQVADIERYRPRVIVGFGNYPLEWATNGAIKGGVTVWRGQRIPVRIGTHTCWFYPVAHPSYVNRVSNERKKGAEIGRFFDLDMERIFREIETLPEPWVPTVEEMTEGIHCITTYGSAGLDEIEHHLKELLHVEDPAIDIEGNALRPYNKASHISTIATGVFDHVVAFPVHHPEARWTPLDHKRLGTIVRDYLLRSKKKWAHNAKMELEWFSYTYGGDLCYETEWGDTMAQQYVIDCTRPKAMDDCTLRHFGFDEKAVFNVDRRRIDQQPLSIILPYNGMDAKWCDALRVKHLEIIEAERGLRDDYALRMRRLPALVRTQQRGVLLDTGKVVELNKHLGTKMRETEAKIFELPDVQRFVRERGKFTHTGGPDLATLLRDQLKLSEGWKQQPDGTKKYSTEEDVLEAIQHPVGKLMLDFRRIQKLKGTYSDEFMPVTPENRKRGAHLYDDGRLHANFNHLVAVTGRLASDDPNLQNIPIRTAEGRKVREAFIPDAATCIGAFDYGQIEARVIAMASKDKTLVDQIWENYDIHTDWAVRLATDFPHVIGGKRFLTDKAAMKEWRNTIKNGWTFPLFYGNVLPAVAHDLDIDRDKLEPYYNDFWDTYPGVLDWQDTNWAFYLAHGYVETLTGHRWYGPLSKNEAANGPIQGTASDIVVDGMERLAIMSYQQRDEYLQPIMNIHDDLTFYLLLQRLERYVETIAKEMCLCTRYSHFINVPIAVEVSLAYDSWAKKEELHTFRSTEFA